MHDGKLPGAVRGGVSANRRRAINVGGVMQLLKYFIQIQQWLSRNFDRLLPGKFRVDGQKEFQDKVVPRYLQRKQVVYDVGGGKRPYLNKETKKRLDLTVIGLDISKDELAKAPEGIYDQQICSDITFFKGEESADLVICQSLLEHIKNVDAAICAISTTLKPGGLALLFLPNKNAFYARLNLLLPQGLKNKALALFYPQMKKKLGFPAYYNKCTPGELKKLAAFYNFSIVEEKYYYNSIYLRFFFPLHLLWRLWLIFFCFISREQAAETFTFVLKKN